VSEPAHRGSLLSAEDVARTCGLSRRAVYDAIRRGELRAFRLCSRLRVRPEDLDSWLLGNAVKAPKPAPRIPVKIRREALPSGSFRAKLQEGRRAER